MVVERRGWQVGGWFAVEGYRGSGCCFPASFLLHGFSFWIQISPISSKISYVRYIERKLLQTKAFALGVQCSCCSASLSFQRGFVSWRNLQICWIWRCSGFCLSLFGHQENPPQNGERGMVHIQQHRPSLSPAVNLLDLSTGDLQNQPG